MTPNKGELILPSEVLEPFVSEWSATYPTLGPFEAQLFKNWFDGVSDLSLKDYCKEPDKLSKAGSYLLLLTACRLLANNLLPPDSLAGRVKAWFLLTPEGKALYMILQSKKGLAAKAVIEALDRIQ